MQLSSAELKTCQYSSTGVQTSSIRLVNAAPCNSAQLNAAQYSSIQHNPTWKSIEYAYVLDSASSTMNFKDFKDFLRLNSEKLWVSSARTKISWNSILRSCELALLESGWTVSMLGATPSPERSEGRARQKMNISGELWSNGEIRSFKFQLALLDSFDHNALPVPCQERFGNCA